MEVVEPDDPHRDYVPLILRAMARQDLAQRKLADKTGIGKSRLGMLLHGDPAKRSVMTLPELETILHALGTNIVQASIFLETFKDFDDIDQERYGTTVLMLTEFAMELPLNLIRGLMEISGIDGSEVKRDWHRPLLKAVVKKVSDEVVKIRDRRARITEGDDFDI